MCHVLLSENIYVQVQRQGEWQKELTYTNNMEKERNIFRSVPEIQKRIEKRINSTAGRLRIRSLRTKIASDSAADFNAD